MDFIDNRRLALEEFTERSRIAREFQREKTLNALKKGIWIYLILLLIEGGLRKWVFPGLSNPLLIIRDPVAMWLIYKAWQKKLLPATPILALMTLIGCISFLTTLIWGHGNLLVAIYGARLLLLHFPVIYIIGKVFTREDVVDVGIKLLWISLPMTLLIAVQFYSPQSAFVNRGIGGDLLGGGFSGANGFFRPPATFSFITGTVLFYGLITCYIFYFWINIDEKVNKLLLIASTFCLIMSVPLSISRSLIGEVILTIVFLVLATGRKPKYLLKIILIGVVIFSILLVLSNYSFFQTSVGAITTRVTNASGSEGGVEGTFANRYLGGLIGALSSAYDQPIFGLGLGLGSNVGSQLIAGKRGFTVSEEEWGRIIGEMGPFFGLSTILLRVSFVVSLVVASYKKVIMEDILPWMLLSFGAILIAQGQWAQPTTEGFATIAGGLILASLRGSKLVDAARKIKLR